MGNQCRQYEPSNHIQNACQDPFDDQQQVGNEKQGNLIRQTMQKKMIHNRFLPYSKIYSKCKSENPKEAQEKQNQQVKTVIDKKKKRCSIEMNHQIKDIAEHLNNKLNGNNTLTQLNTFDYIQIHTSRFIAVHKGEISKSYEFKQKIGQGAYGIVYKALHLRSNELRAIKKVKFHRMTSKQQKQFLEQIQVLRQLDHPNIIKLYQVFYNQIYYYVVTEYCVGGTALDFITARGNANVAAIREIIRQILRALNYIHQAGYVHRDVKLENMVFLSQTKKITDRANLKLIDFGSACKLDGKRESIKDLVGTLSYMAPEVLNRQHSQKCDIWSVGVVLYVLITGRTPFKAKQKKDTIYNIYNKIINFKTAQFKNINPSVVDLLSQMLQRKENKRLSAAQALQNPWFQQNVVENGMLQNAVLQNLRGYYRSNNFISVIESYLVFSRISQQQRNSLAEIFSRIDKNCDGTIEVSQLQEAFKTQQLSNSEQITQILQKIDKDKSGKISLSEFMAALSNKRKLFIREYLDEAFQSFDTDKTGYIEKDELKDLISGCEKGQLNQLMEQMDSNHDKKVSKNQFFQYLQKHNYFFQ